MILTVIPARLKSVRLPNKPLILIGDRPMLWWTWQKALQSKLSDRVVIATDSEKIYNTMQAFGAECQMTSENCTSGSDRVFEVAQRIPQAKIIVNFQGDEPLMPLQTLDGTIQTLLDNPGCQIGTAITSFKKELDFLNPNQVKAVFNMQNRALYFSRAPLANAWLHIGLYVFKKEALFKFCQMPPSSLELAEKLEQLRALESNMPIYVYKETSDQEHFGIDTPEDLERAKQIFSLAVSQNAG